MQFVITIAFLAFSGLTLALPTQERTDAELTAHGEGTASEALDLIVTTIGGLDQSTEVLALGTLAGKVATAETGIGEAIDDLKAAITGLTG